MKQYLITLDKQLILITMTKQEFLDIENPSIIEDIAQKLLTRSNKTSILTFKRAVDAIDRLLYKTSDKQITLQQLWEALVVAKKYATLNDKTNEND